MWEQPKIEKSKKSKTNQTISLFCFSFKLYSEVGKVSSEANAPSISTFFVNQGKTTDAAFVDCQLTPHSLIDKLRTW
jgi:predicted nucleic acid binding AN1-type Zn finger protein